MTQTSKIRTPEQLYAHAIAIEREAAARYAELGERMADLGNDVVGELFLRLAQLEKAHEQALEQRAAGFELPAIAPGDAPGETRLLFTAYQRRQFSAYVGAMKDPIRTIAPVSTGAAPGRMSRRATT